MPFLMSFFLDGWMGCMGGGWMGGCPTLWRYVGALVVASPVVVFVVSWNQATVAAVIEEIKQKTMSGNDDFGLYAPAGTVLLGLWLNPEHTLWHYSLQGTPPFFACTTRVRACACARLCLVWFGLV